MRIKKLNSHIFLKHAHILKTLYILTLFITAKFFTISVVFAQMYQFSLNLSSLQQKFSLTSNYLGTNTVIVKRFDCTYYAYLHTRSYTYIHIYHPTTTYSRQDLSRDMRFPTISALFHHFGTMTHAPDVGNFSTKTPKIGFFSVLAGIVKS